MVSLETVCDIPTPSSSTTNEMITAATERSWRNSRIDANPIETNTRPATISVCGANRSASFTTPMPAIMDTMDRKFAITEELNGPYRNRPMSSIGVALRFWRRTNMNAAPMPITNAKATTVDSPSCAAVLIAQTNGSIATSDRITLIGSSGPGFGSFDSGTSRGARTSSGNRIGTATRNTEPQWKC